MESDWNFMHATFIEYSILFLDFNKFPFFSIQILGAKNKELNAWASLKKATQIRPEHVERNDQLIFQKKAKNDALKRKILQSLYEP